MQDGGRKTEKKEGKSCGGRGEGRAEERGDLSRLRLTSCVTFSQ